MTRQVRGEAPTTVHAAVPGQVFVVLYSMAALPFRFVSPVKGALTVIWLQPLTSAVAVPVVVLVCAWAAAGIRHATARIVRNRKPLDISASFLPAVLMA